MRVKPATVFMGELTSPEVEAFLKGSQTIIVPTGSTEQHGPHGPLLTDVASTTTPTQLHACASAVSNGLPTDVTAFPINYWDGITAEESAEFFGPTTGLHANRGETSAVMAINPALVDLDNANAEMPPFPEVTNSAPVHTAFFFSNPGSVYRATKSGTWGDGRDATPEFGERYLTVARDR